MECERAHVRSFATPIHTFRSFAILHHRHEAKGTKELNHSHTSTAIVLTPLDADGLHRIRRLAWRCSHLCPRADSAWWTGVHLHRPDTMAVRGAGSVWAELFFRKQSLLSLCQVHELHANTAPHAAQQSPAVSTVPPPPIKPAPVQRNQRD